MSEKNRSQCAIRLRSTSDDPQILVLYRSQEQDSAPLLLDSLPAAPDSRSTLWVAMHGETVAGFGGFYPAWWTGEQNAYEVSLRVASAFWRQGIGSQLFATLQERLEALGATRLEAWVREDSAEGRAFAARFGFQETGLRLQECRLAIPDAPLTEIADREARLYGEGVRFASLEELGTENEAFLRGLQRLWASGAGEPLDSEALDASFSTWRNQVLCGQGLSSETHWVAIDGEMPVGMTFLKRLDATNAENDYTGVAKSHRGRGIATALKRRAIAWAKENGLLWFHTASHEENSPMIGINRRLGYEAGACRLKIAKSL